MALAFSFIAPTLLMRTVRRHEDSPATQYQFPKQYLSRVSQCVGDWIVYYEPTKVPGSKATTHSGEALSLKGRGE
jgi:hypothetical protein